MTLAGYGYTAAAKEMGLATSTVHSSLVAARKRLGIERLGIGALYSVLLSRGCLKMPREIPGSEYYGTWLQSIVRDNEWRPSAAQRSYLNAFDSFLYNRCDESAAERMSLAFQLMQHESGQQPREPIPADAAVDRLDEMLTHIGRALTRSIGV